MQFGGKAVIRDRDELFASFSVTESSSFRFSPHTVIFLILISTTLIFFLSASVSHSFLSLPPPLFLFFGFPDRDFTVPSLILIV